METAAIGKDLVGTVIDGRFTLIQWLGGSAAGSVFLTEADGQRAAIKLIAADAADANARTAAWAATSSLAHPHLARLFYTGQCPGDPEPLLYAVTEYSGELLSQIIPERPLTPAEATEMLAPILDALSYLHSKGVVHGHLKPSNIMVVDDQLKISSDSLQLTGEFANRPSKPDIYYAPEFAEGRALPSADLWSLGATLVESLTRHPPVWPREVQPDPQVPESIEPLFARIARECLRSDPARRCKIGTVTAFLNPAPFVPDSPSDPVKRLPSIQPTRFPVKTVIALALVLVAIVVGFELRSRSLEPAPQAVNEPAPEFPAPPPQSPAPVNPIVQGPPVKGAVAEQVSPDVLPSARATVHGQVNVSVRVTVDASGNLSNAAFDSPGPSKYFARQAMQAAQHWRFKPAQADGKPVSSVWILRFHFTQSGTDMTPVQVSP
jgi:TonB family protein